LIGEEFNEVDVNADEELGSFVFNNFNKHPKQYLFEQPPFI